MSIKESIQKNIRENVAAVKGITKDDVKSFCKNNWVPLLRIGVFCAVSVLASDNSVFANSVGGNTASEGATGISPLDKPLQTIHTALTGPIPKIVTGVCVAMGGMSWAMGWEQQIMNRCVKGAGGGAIALGVGKFMENMFGTTISGTLF